MTTPIVISIINHKGGVGKTTSTVNIAAGLAKLGKKVLAIDLDTQMNLTHSLIGDVSENDITITEVILSEKISLMSAIKGTDIENLDIVPAGESMIDLELKLHSVFGRESLLKRSLNNEHAKQYDFILVDNKPHLGLTTVNSLIASHYYLVPVSAEYLPMIGIKHLINTIEQIRPLNLTIKNLGYLLTMVDRRESISTDVENILRKTFESEVFESVVRINTKLKATPQKRKSIFQVETAKGKGHADYLDVTKELLKRIERN